MHNSVMSVFTDSHDYKWKIKADIAEYSYLMYVQTVTLSVASYILYYSYFLFHNLVWRYIEIAVSCAIGFVVDSK